MLQYCAGGFDMLNKGVLAVLTLLMLTACSNKEEDLSAKESQRATDDTPGFEMNGGEVKEAENVPADDEKEILAAFDEYIAALNAEEIERYMKTLSNNPKGFNYEEEEAYVTDVFEKFDITRDVENITIAKYNENEAQVYANMTLHSMQLETDVEHESAGRQVTVFVKEDDDWKVSSVYYIGDDSKSSTSN